MARGTNDAVSRCRSRTPAQKGYSDRDTIFSSPMPKSSVGVDETVVNYLHTSCMLIRLQIHVHASESHGQSLVKCLLDKIIIDFYVKETLKHTKFNLPSSIHIFYELKK